MAIMHRCLILALLAFGLPAMGQQIFNCSSFSSSGSCGVSLIGAGGQAFAVVGTPNGATPSISDGSAIIANADATHFALSMMYQTLVNVEAFTTTFTFVPDGQNIAFTLNNCGTAGPESINSCGGFGGRNFSSGASCEGGFSQSAGEGNVPYNIFALMLDSSGNLNNSGGSFFSSAQIYQEDQSPCNPSSIVGGDLPYWSTNKFSTSPVALTSPATAAATTTGDTYSATIIYDGSNLTLNLFDLTAGGTCSPTTSGTCFSHTWSNVSLPSQVDGTTAFVGFVGSSGEPSVGPLTVSSWNYTVNTPTASPTSTPTAAGAPVSANPTFSPAPGTFTGSQSVTISDTTPDSNICFMLGSRGQVIQPITDNLGGCSGSGTAYTGPVTVSSTQTLYAVAGTNGTSNTGLSSGVVQGDFVINSSSTTASTPTFSPAAGTFTGTQSVTISTTSSGAIECFTTNGTAPATNGTTGCTTGTLVSGPVSVAASETINAVAGGTGFTDSSVGSAAYTINATPPSNVFSGHGTMSGTSNTH